MNMNDSCIRGKVHRCPGTCNRLIGTGLLGRTAIGLAALSRLSAVAFGRGGDYQLTWQPGSSVKVEQVIGDFDWESVYFGAPRRTASQTVTKADVLGNDLGYSFEHNGGLVFLFGDTIGATADYYPNWVTSVDNYLWQAHDPIGFSDSRFPGNPLVVNFKQDSSGNTLYVNPVYPDGTVLPMNGNETPNSGISLDGPAYIVCGSGNDPGAADPRANDYSVLTKFNDRDLSFNAGRTISQVNQGGHFVVDSLHEYTTGCGADEDSVLMFGEGNYRASDIYLSVTPKRGFWSGIGTCYFTGLVHGQPTWSLKESDAQPVVVDNPLNSVPPDPPTVGNMSVTYSPDLRLWLMTYDGGRVSSDTTGIYFTYAKQPYGPPLGDSAVNLQRKGRRWDWHLYS